MLLDKNITIRVLAALYLKNKPELYLSELLKNKIATTDLFYILDYCKNTNFKESAKFLKNLLKRKNCITIEEKAISTLLSFNSKENDIFLINIL